MKGLRYYLRTNAAHFYWRLLFGRPVRRSNFLKLRQNGFMRLDGPVFFLSTGRTGTMWFTHLLNCSSRVNALHQEPPDLAIQSRMAYELYANSNWQLTSFQEQALREIFLVAREQYIRYAYKTKTTLVETNNNFTFFAPILAKVFPNAKFVHLYRHPGDFVRSGLRRRYYLHEFPLDQKHIIPLSSEMQEKWQNYSQLEKVAWLWNETNAFIERFKSSIPEEQIIALNFSEKNVQKIYWLLDFLNISIKERYIKKSLNKRRNKQKKRSYPPYSQWPEQDKEALKAICGELAEKYHLKL